jgi:hypothetical protein
MVSKNVRHDQQVNMKIYRKLEISLTPMDISTYPSSRELDNNHVTKITIRDMLI